jgi:NTE family protein
LSAALQPDNPTDMKAKTRQSKDEMNVLVLQGGGALGAYQAGAYEALAEAGYQPDWIAGISIGAINGSIIAGNPPEARIERLRTFWETVSSGLQGTLPFFEDYLRTYFNEASANLAATFGIPGFFRPRIPSPYLQPPGSASALSLYDTAPLARTLADLVDFGYLNKDGPRLSVGAVEITDGNFDYFDSHKRVIGAEHIMASGALPPSFAPVEVDGRYYWDGGIVSNTPIDYVLEYEGAEDDMCVFQIDVFRSKGSLPKTIGEVAEREKDIRYSSRTRFNSDHVRKLHDMGKAARRLMDKLPNKLRDDPDAQLLAQFACKANITLAHIIRHDSGVDSGTKDYEFSRLTVMEHWETGKRDVERGLKKKAWRERDKMLSGIQVFDLTK